MEYDADAVVVGSGPGGSVVADVLTTAGWDVVMLEKGRNRLLDLDPPHDLLGHFSNDEIKFECRHFLGPDPLLEPRTFRRSEADGDRLVTGEVNNLPSTVGGGGYHADGKLPRLREDDFRPLSTTGPVDGAHVADWPVSYDEMEPYYAEVERLIGVAGDAEANPFASWRSGPYPMPPGPDMYVARLTSSAAETLGYHPYRAPTGANSVAYDGRAACTNCGFCAGFGCAVDAKGDSIASLRRALRTGRLDLRPDAYVVDVLLDPSGREATGVAYLDTSGPVGEPTRHVVRARHVVLAGGAFETPRLLLRTGLGNPDVVGRFLMFHVQTYVLGFFEERMHAYRGRDVTHLMDDPIVGDPASRAAARDAGLPFLRGGIVEHGGPARPVREAIHLPPGELHTALMVDSTTRDKVAVFTMQGEDLPQAANRVDLDPAVRDVYGFPAGRVTYTPHRHEVACAAHWAPRLEAVMREAGATGTLWTTSPPSEGLPGADGSFLVPISRHIMGTARMGEDPTTSVFDARQRLHGVENVMCADSSVFPTSSGYGPTLTLAALALRAARDLASLPPLRSSPAGPR